jgi:hypothetical protein
MTVPNEERAAFESEFRAAVRKKFKIDEMVSVAWDGLHCMMVRTHVSKHELVESDEYADWSCRLAWWKAIAQAGGMIAESIESAGGGLDDLIRMAAAAARSRMQE